MAALCAGCGSAALPDGVLIGLRGECIGFPVGARLQYVNDYPALSDRLKDAVLQGRLIPGMRVSDVVKMCGDPDRAYTLAADEAGRRCDEWVYDGWTKLRRGRPGPAVVYVRDGMVIDFIAIDPPVPGAARMRPDAIPLGNDPQP